LVYSVYLVFLVNWPDRRDTPDRPDRQDRPPWPDRPAVEDSFALSLTV